MQPLLSLVNTLVCSFVNVCNTSVLLLSSIQIYARLSSPNNWNSDISLHGYLNINWPCNTILMATFDRMFMKPNWKTWLFQFEVNSQSSGTLVNGV